VADLRGYQFFLLPAIVGVRLAARITGHEHADREEEVGLLNPLLTRINTAEARLARYRWPAPPTGSSLVAVGIKP
jgi:hypothetical protein